MRMRMPPPPPPDGLARAGAAAARPRGSPAPPRSAPSAAVPSAARSPLGSQRGFQYGGWEFRPCPARMQRPQIKIKRMMRETRQLLTCADTGREREGRGRCGCLMMSGGVIHRADAPPWRRQERWAAAAWAVQPTASVAVGRDCYERTALCNPGSTEAGVNTAGPWSSCPRLCALLRVTRVSWVSWSARACGPLDCVYCVAQPVERMHCRGRGGLHAAGLRAGWWTLLLGRCDELRRVGPTRLLTPRSRPPSLLSHRSRWSAPALAPPCTAPPTSHPPSAFCRPRPAPLRSPPGFCEVLRRGAKGECEPSTVAR